MRYIITIFLFFPLCIHAQSKKWADSMERVIYRMDNDTSLNSLDYDAYENAIPKYIKKYMKCCSALGEYYERQYNAGKLPDLSMAMKYYWRAIDIDPHTDGTLYDENRIMLTREKLAAKVANLYNTGKIKGGDTIRNYVVARYLKEPLINAPQQMDWVISSDTSSLTIRFFMGSFVLCDDARSILQNVAVLMRGYPYKQMAVIGNGNDSYYNQQMSYDRVEAVISYLTDKCGIDRERFFFEFGQPGDVDLVQMRFTQPGESGPSIVAPPYGGAMRYKSR